MIGVHEIHAQEYFDKGYVEVKRTGPRIWFANPENTCLRKMRDGHCTVDRGHRGRCSTVTFCCDFCDKTQRGTPAAANEDCAICWMCQNRKR